MTAKRNIFILTLIILNIYIAFGFQIFSSGAEGHFDWNINVDDALTEPGSYYYVNSTKTLFFRGTSLNMFVNKNEDASFETYSIGVQENGSWRYGPGTLGGGEQFTVSNKWLYFPVTTNGVNSKSIGAFGYKDYCASTCWAVIIPYPCDCGWHMIGSYIYFDVVPDNGIDTFTDIYFNTPPNYISSENKKYYSHDFECWTIIEETKSGLVNRDINLNGNITPYTSNNHVLVNKEGINVITFSAKDRVNNQVIKSDTIFIDTQAPTLPAGANIFYGFTAEPDTERSGLLSSLEKITGLSLSWPKSTDPEPITGDTPGITEASGVGKYGISWVEGANQTLPSKFEVAHDPLAANESCNVLFADNENDITAPNCDYFAHGGTYTFGIKSYDRVGNKNETDWGTKEIGIPPKTITIGDVTYGTPSVDASSTPAYPVTITLDESWADLPPVSRLKFYYYDATSANPTANFMGEVTDPSTDDPGKIVFLAVLTGTQHAHKNYTYFVTIVHTQLQGITGSIEEFASEYNVVNNKENGLVANIPADYTFFVKEAGPDGREWLIGDNGYFAGTTNQASISTQKELELSLLSWTDVEGDAVSFRLYSFNGNAITPEFFTDTPERKLFRASNVNLPCFVTTNERFGSGQTITDTNRSVHQGTSGEEGIVIHFDFIDPYGDFELTTADDTKRVLSTDSPVNTTEVSLAITDANMAKLLAPANPASVVTFWNIDASLFPRLDKIVPQDIMSTEASSNKTIFTVDGGFPGNAGWTHAGDKYYFDWTLLPPPPATQVDEIRLVAMKISDGTNSYYTWYMTRLNNIIVFGPPDISSFGHYFGTNGDITLTWRSVGDSYTYIVSYPQDENATTNTTVEVGPVIAFSTVSHTIPVENNFSANKAIPVTVRTKDSAGNLSAEVAYTLYTKPVLGTVTGPVQGYDQTDGIYLEWTLTGTIASRTSVLYKLSGETNYTEYTPAVQPAGVLRLPHLAGHETYDCKLRAYNGFIHPVTGAKADFVETEAGSHTLANNVPTIPVIIGPIDYTNAAFRFEWQTSTDADTDALHYELYVKDLQGGDILFVPDIENAQTSSQVYEPTTAEMNPEDFAHGSAFKWYVAVKDGYGGTSVSDEKTVTIDKESPTARFENLPGAAFTNQGSISLVVESSLSGIGRIEYWASCEECGLYSASNPGQLIAMTGSQEVPLQQSSSNQPYSIIAKVTSNAGTAITIASPQMQVDRTSPVTTLASHGMAESGYLYYANSRIVPITATSSDDYSGVKYIEYAFVKNGESEATADWIKLNNVPLSEGVPGARTAQGDCALAGEDGSEGSLLFRTVDWAGNTGTSYSLSRHVMIDTTPPSGRINVLGCRYYKGKYYTGDFTQLAIQPELSDMQSEVYERSFNVAASGDAPESLAWYGTWTEAKAAFSPVEGGAFIARVKAKNRAGLEASIASDEIVYDSTAPVNVGLTYDESGAFAADEVVRMTAHAEDYGSPVTTYVLSIGTGAGDTSVSFRMNGNRNGFIEETAATGDSVFTLRLPADIASGAYMVTLIAYNAAGSSALQAKTLTVDNAAERVLVWDSGPYMNTNHSLSAEWKYIGTNTIGGYLYRIMGLGEPDPSWIETNETSVQVGGLSIPDGTLCRFEVRALYETSGYATGRSIGVTIDTTQPALGGMSVPSYSTPENLNITWHAADAESGIERVDVLPERMDSEGNMSGLTGEWISLPATQDGVNIPVTRTDDGDPIHIENGDEIYLSLRITNKAGLSVERRSAPVIIDTTRPPEPVVIDQGITINTAQLPSASWLWTKDDPESGTETREWTVVTQREDIDEATTWYPDDGSGSIDLEEAISELPNFTLTPAHGATWYFAVRVTNKAGLATIGFSNGITFDNEGPVVSDVKIMKGTGTEEALYIADGTQLSVFIQAHDTISGIASYNVTQGTWNAALEWEDTGEGTAWNEEDSVVALQSPSPVLHEGDIAYFKGNCMDAAGNISSYGYTKGAFYDPGIPVVRNVFGFVTDGDLVVRWDVTPSLSPVTHYEVALRALGASQAVFTATTEDRSIVIDCDAYGITDDSYELYVKAVNAAGTESAEAHSPQILLDRTAPEILSLTSDRYVYDRLFFSVTAHDNHTGIRKLEYALGTTANPDLFTQGWMSEIALSETLAKTIVFSELPGGLPAFQNGTEITLSVKAMDGAGQWSPIAQSSPIVVDKTPPAIPTVSLGDYTRFADMITGIGIASSDTESGLQTVKTAIIPDDTWGAIENAQWTETLIDIQSGESYTVEDYIAHINAADPAMTHGGTYYFAVAMRNKAGLWSEPSVSEGVVVDATPPQLTFTSGEDEIVYNTEDFVIPYNITEDVSPPVYVVFSLVTSEGYTYTFPTTETAPGTERTFTYSYDRPGYGAYELYARLEDGAGHIVNRTASQVIRVNMPHEIVFDTGTNDWFLTNPAKPITLSATIIDNDGDNDGSMQYAWDLDDDGTADTTEATPLTNYTHSQIENIATYHTIRLTITDKNNLSVTKTGTVKVVNTTKGRLYTNEYWSGTHVLEGEIEIPQGITLTTAPVTDVRVSYDPTIGYAYGLLVKGILHAQPGTRFGIPDTVEDKWKGIDIEGVASLDTVTIEDAERGITVVPGSNAMITGCILNNNIAGIHVYGTAQLITGTLFSNNLYGVKEETGSSPVLVNCVFEDNIIDYYHKTLTRITMDELNSLFGNSGNVRQGE